MPDNFHRLVYCVLGSVLAVCLAIQSGALVLPPNLQGAQFYAVVGVIALGFFLPHFGTDTTAPPLLRVGVVPLPPAAPPVVPPAHGIGGSDAHRR